MTTDNLKMYSKKIEIDFLAATQNDYLDFTDYVLARTKEACRDICKAATSEGLVQAWNPKRVFVDLSAAIYENINSDRFSCGLRGHFYDPFTKSKPDEVKFALFGILDDEVIKIAIYYPPLGFNEKAYDGSLTIKKVIFNPPATVIYWSDGSKTVSKVQDGDTWDSEKGLAMAIIKKTIGLKEFYKHFDEHAVNANFWYGAPEALVKTSVEKYGFEPHMDAIVSKYGTDKVKAYLKSVEENGMEEKK